MIALRLLLDSGVRIDHVIRGHCAEQNLGKLFQTVDHLSLSSANRAFAQAGAAGGGTADAEANRGAPRGGRGAKERWRRCWREKDKLGQEMANLGGLALGCIEADC